METKDEEDKDGDIDDDESEPTVGAMDEDEFNFAAIDALRGGRKPRVMEMEKPIPKEEDVVARAQAFQRNRKLRTPWRPGRNYFTIPEGKEEEVTSEEEDELFTRLISQHRADVRAQPAAKQPASNETFADIAARGANFMKYGRHGKPHIKIVRVDASTGKLSYGTGTLALQDAIDIVAGKNTKVFEGVKHKYAHPSVCFSIILRNRTLDLRATNEEERDRWLSGLKALKKELDSKADEDSPDEEELAQAQKNRMVSLQRQDTTIAFRAIATAGVPVKKYTRVGKAHARILKLNFNTGTLDWQTGSVSLLNVTAINPGTSTSKHPAGSKGAERCFSIVSPGRTVDFKVASLLSRNMWISGLLGVLENTQQQARSRSDSESSTVKLFSQCATEGTPLLKYGKRGAPKKKIVKVDLVTGNVSWVTGALNLADASAIVAADTTQKTLMSSIKRQNPKHGFSIIMSNRQVDLEANSETERDLWVQGLKNLHRKLELEAAVEAGNDEDGPARPPARPPEQARSGKIESKTSAAGDSNPRTPKRPTSPARRRKKSLIIAMAGIEKQMRILQLENKRLGDQNKILEEHVSQLHTKYGLPPFTLPPYAHSPTPGSPSHKAVVWPSSPSDRPVALQLTEKVRVPPPPPPESPLPASTTSSSSSSSSSPSSSSPPRPPSPLISTASSHPSAN